MRRPALKRSSLRSLKLFTVVAATWFFAVPQLPTAWDAVGNLAGIPVGLLLMGASCAVLALVAYAQLTRTMLDDGQRPSLPHAFGITMTSLGINRVMPGGAAVGGVMTFRLLERAGVSRPRAAFAMATQSIGSAVVLNLLLWVGLLVALPSFGCSATYLTVIAGGAVLIGIAAATTRALIRDRPWLWTIANTIARFIPRLNPEVVADAMNAQAANMTSLAARPQTVRKAVAWAVINWLLDIAALWVFLAAFGVAFNPLAVVVAFALANIAASLPITPGGLGIVDVTLVATLVGFGAAAVPAALGVAAYRVFNYWLPIPVSVVAYLSVRNIDASSTAPPIPR